MIELPKVSVRLPQVIGFQKCGQNSLIKYLLNKYTNLTSIPRYELIARDRGRQLFRELYQNNYFPIVITRDRVQTIYSRYHYFEFYKTHTLQEYLNIKDPNISPLYQTDFSYHIHRWHHFRPIVYKLEHLQKQKDFPHLNNNKNYLTTKTPTPEEVKMINSAIKTYSKNDPPRLRHE